MESKRKKLRYEAKEAIQIIMEPTSDSEVSDLDDDDDENDEHENSVFISSLARDFQSSTEIPEMETEESEGGNSFQIILQTEEEIDDADKYNPGCENEASEATT